MENNFFHLLILFCFMLLKGSPWLLWIISELTVGRMKAYWFYPVLFPVQNKYLHHTQLLPVIYSGGLRKRTIHLGLKPWGSGCCPLSLSQWLIISTVTALCLSVSNPSVLSFWIMILVLSVSASIKCFNINIIWFSRCLDYTESCDNCINCPIKQN